MVAVEHRVSPMTVRSGERVLIDFQYPVRGEQVGQPRQSFKQQQQCVLRLTEKRTGAVPSMMQSQYVPYVDEDPPALQNQTASFGIKGIPQRPKTANMSKRPSTLMKPTKASMAKTKF